MTDVAHGLDDPDAPLPIGTVDEARAASAEYARLACTPLSTNDPGLMWATLAVAAELRALSLVIQQRRVR